MRIALLGPMRVQAAGVPLEVRGLRARRAIALLALNAGRPVALTQLVDTLWPEDPPATFREQVYNCVAGLRRMLGAGPRPEVDVVRTDGGYALTIAADRVDALAFEAALRTAAARAAAGDRAGAGAVLRSGLRLWRGEALEGVVDGPLGFAATRLDRLRGEAWERLFEMEMGVRRDPGLIAEMSAVAERYPLREVLTCQLGTVLWRAGRAAQALEVCREHRRRVLAEFGVEAGPAVRDLEARIRATQPAAEPRPAAAVDRLIADVEVLLAEVRGLLTSARCPACHPG
ncbi:BTAD domain-containing putative transcriptional regulator [Asanoa sp. NPDC049573]|uniref:AfsR/SARP family transcriptional regulator n=1 Tax=Asanoa sp. NPDC049573 TaxID=3155396 RepID=UPI003414A39F